MATDATSPKVMVPNFDSEVIHESAAAGVREVSTPVGSFPPWFLRKYSMEAARGQTPSPSTVVTSLWSAR